jgi:CRP-like cAMP-binding protein
LEPKQFEELSNLVVDKKFKAGKTIFDLTKRTNAALYVVREGSVELSGSRSDVIKPGAYFGEDLLLLDSHQDAVSGHCAPTKTLPGYFAIAREDCLCGMLSLSDCRTIFDTTKMVANQATSEMIHAESPNIDNEAIDTNAVTNDALQLRRESTDRWLKRTSADGLRNAVRKNIKIEQLERHNLLGEGQFGEVWLVSALVCAKYGQQHFALKLQKKGDPTRGDSVAAIKREIEILGMLDHPYIVNYVHSYEDPEKIFILMGLVHGGELFDVIHTENGDGTWSSGIPECDAKFYAMVVADTLDYIHRKQFIYRDLKPENILIVSPCGTCPSFVL